ncbi:MAG: hypothetical protein EB829_02135 [Nitrosopumilus sp. H8]|nr:MAG: hypothetical protein EB830_01995 [Nitrosopumilus sp. H13]RNJ79399.1 MAG: hypothetical protein EB829_02135 [Nitrosopumilus sp. H8]
MKNDEIKVPKEIREFLPEWVRETRLGQKNGARRQYRYGNLHIREYDDEFLVHTDMFDPREKPLEHLIFDAQEVLAGMACGALAGYTAAKRAKNPKAAVASGIISSIITGYLGYLASKKLKERL